jgi:uncharacterized RDD family membrane protein YckC
LSRSIRKKQLKPDNGSSPVPGFLRRLAAIIYDLFLLLALLFFATALLLPLNAGEAFTSQQFFYAWFWTHGGQTLGLRTWKLKVLTLNGEPITWKQAFLRFLGAIISWAFLGLGFLWILIDKNRRGWHDYLSKTALFFDSQDMRR